MFLAKNTVRNTVYPGKPQFYCIKLELNGIYFLWTCFHDVLSFFPSFVWMVNLNLFDLTHLSLASLLWDIAKQNSPRWDAAERGVPSGAILFVARNFIEK